MAGESALSRQLKKLSVPQTAVLIQDKIRKSFLFDHRDAAGLDRDLIFAYGSNGFEKLCNINPMFSKFEKNLFNLNYKEYERSVQSASANAKLDEKITEFLRMLSPYFLIKAAHEAIEWLIYRFHIHLYNIDALLSSVIPYYNTSTFVRVVHLLDLDERSRWFWLKQIQKTGMHLDYSAVLNRFNSDAGFRKFICDIAPNVLSVYKDHESAAVPIITFSMITIYNALDKCEVDDRLVLFLLPYILNGLSSNVIKYTASSYMIVSQIMVKVKLTSEIVETLLIKIFSTFKTDLINEMCQLTLLVFQFQSVKSLPPKFLFLLLSNDESMGILSHLSNNFEASTLMKSIIKKSISMMFNVYLRKSKKMLTFFKRFMNVVKLDKKSVLQCFRLTLKKYSKFSKARNVKLIPQQYTKATMCIIKFLERKYPEFFDIAYKKFLQKKSTSDKKLLCKLIHNSVCNMQYKMLPNMKTTLILGLNHVNAQIRQTSVSYLLKLANNESSDKGFIGNALHDRLFDESPHVVLTLLSNIEVFEKVLDKTQLLNAFEWVLQKEVSRGSEWYNVQIMCLDVVIKYFANIENSFDFLQLVLPFLFPVNKHTIERFLHVLNSNIENNFFQCLKSMYIKAGKIDVSDKTFFHVNYMILVSLKSYVEQMNEDLKLRCVSFLMSKTATASCSLLALTVHVMQYMILGNVQGKNLINFVKALLQVFQLYFLQPNIKWENFQETSEESIIKMCICSLNKNILPVSFIYYNFYKIITNLQLNLEHITWPSEKEFCYNYKILTCLFDFCILQLNSEKDLLSNSFKSLISLFFSYQFKNIQSIFWFLSTKWINNSNDIPYIIQLCSLNIAASFCNENITWLFNDDVIFLCLIKTVANPNYELRYAALSILSSSLISTKDCVHSYRFLGEGMLLKSEEIKIDCKQSLDSVLQWLQPAIEYIDITRTTSTYSSDKNFQNNVIVLRKFLNLLTIKEVPSSIKHFLLLCLQDADSVTILSAYVPVLSNCLTLLETGENSKDQQLEMIDLLLKKFTPKTAVCLTENSDESKILFRCLNFVFNITNNDADRSVQILTLNVLSKEFFSAIPSISVQQQLFDVLLILYMVSPTDVVNKVEKVLRKLCTYAYLLLRYLCDKELAVMKGTTLREAKRSKPNDNNLNNVSNFENGPWKKITIFLELMQNKSKLHKKEILIPELFNLLNKSLDFDNQPAVEYIKQLILSAIYSCCQQLGSTGLDERHFQVELIVQCIRNSTNPKTHHQSLLLLNLAATIFPDYVLTNVMSIFTFMGSSLVRQDDSYSFQVISQTIETIVPSLLQASNQQKETDGIQVVASVIRVFVDSLADIPGHRQLPLFTKLITTLDPSEYLWIPLGQICDQYATVFHDIATEENSWKISPTLEFAVNLHKQFSPDIQINTCIKLVNFLAMLPETKEQFESNPDLFETLKEPFNVLNHTNKQLQIFKHNVFSYMKIWLSSQVFISQVLELNSKQQYNLEEKYEMLLESVLNLLQKQLNMVHFDKNAGKTDDFLKLIYDLVYAITSLLPCNLFIKVTRRLLKNGESEIQVKAVELLNSKLEQEEFVRKENHKYLLKLLKTIVQLSNKCFSDEKYVVAQQSLLYALYLLSKLIGAEYPIKFYKVLNICITILCKSSKPELIANALLCLAQLCNCLSVDILPHLNTFMPVIINILQKEEILIVHESLILRMSTALQSIIENLGVFLSTYIQDIITSICIFSSKYSELGKKNIIERFSNLQSKLANEIPLRVLHTAVEQSYLKLSVDNVKSIIYLMNILTEKLNFSTYDDILSCSTQLQKFYISLLDFRNNNPSLLDISAIENSIIVSFYTFAKKLKETHFHTFFQKIYQWVTTSNDDYEQKYRVFTFYKLTSEFSKSLNELFSPVAKYFFRHVASILNSNNITKCKHYYYEDLSLSHELLVNVLDTLNYCFMYSNKQLLDKENFDMLMQPLVDQIENFIDETHYQEIIENHLSSCIAYFMIDISDSALWKSLNYQILLKTRHESPKVRFAALQVIQEVVKKMGDNYLVLLPESIPFLAEIMEDESSEVEHECQNVIIEMEKILGEPIRKYF